eukprot:4698878-Pyramimonas_sp.AAC.1
MLVCPIIKQTQFLQNRVVTRSPRIRCEAIVKRSEGRGLLVTGSDGCILGFESALLNDQRVWVEQATPHSNVSFV